MGDRIAVHQRNRNIFGHIYMPVYKYFQVDIKKNYIFFIFHKAIILQELVLLCLDTNIPQNSIESIEDSVPSYNLVMI